MNEQPDFCPVCLAKVSISAPSPPGLEKWSCAKNSKHVFFTKIEDDTLQDTYEHNGEDTNVREQTEGDETH